MVDSRSFFFFPICCHVCTFVLFGITHSQSMQGPGNEWWVSDFRVFTRTQVDISTGH